MVNQTEVTGQAVNSSIKYYILLREQDLTQTETFDFILLAWGGFKKTNFILRPFVALFAMAANNAAVTAVSRKLWPLTTSETFTSYMNWQENLVYVLTLDARFTSFMEDGEDSEWEDGDADNHGFVDGIQVENQPAPQTAVQKVRKLHLMLGQIANYCNVISRHQILHESTSLNSIWEMIREHFGFNVTGSRFLDLSSIRLRPGEKPADLYQRIVCFFTDNLFTRSSKLTHKGKEPTVDEKLTPTLQNTVVLIWLERIHAGLPGLVKQRYGTELRNKTLASIKSEISQALDSMLEELGSGEDTRVMRLQPSRSSNYQRGRGNNRMFRNQSSYRGSFNSQQPSNPKICSICKTANISGWDNHYLSQCKHLSDPDRKRLAMSTSRVRQVETGFEDEYYEDDYEEEVCETMDNSLFIDNPSSSCHRRVSTRKSPHMSCFYDHYPIQMCLDTGSESNLVSERFAQHAGIPILKQNVHQGAVQADTNSKLDIVGEIKNAKIRRGAQVFTLDALVTKQDVGDIIAGEPFLEQNDIAVRSAKKQIIIRGNEVIPYANSSSL